jgi:hypothetical protein
MHCCVSYMGEHVRAVAKHVGVMHERVGHRSSSDERGPANEKRHAHAAFKDCVAHRSTHPHTHTPTHPHTHTPTHPHTHGHTQWESR